MRSLVLILLIFSLTSGRTSSQDGTNWRGPESNGVYSEIGLMNGWSAEGPQVLWYYNRLGGGYSSPVFASDKIYLTGMEGTTGYLYCLSSNGKLLWKKTYGPEWSESYPGSRTSPKIVGGKVYMMSARGGLVCMDAGNGNILWSKDLLKDFGGKNISWGMTENMVVYGDKIICTPGDTRNNIIALNRHDGSLIWSSRGKGENSAYCSPLFIKHNGKALIITHTANNILGLDADNGNLLWSYPHTNQYSVHANTPIYSNGSVYCFSGYGRGGVKLKLSDDGSSITKEWTNRTMDSRFGGAVMVNGFIYGSGDYNREWQCIDWRTGKQVHTSTVVGKGTVIYADGKLFCYSERGELAMMRPLSDRFELLGKARVGMGPGPHWTHPVIHESILYIRHGNTLIAYKIK